jgi:hypothetical protein
MRVGDAACLFGEEDPGLSEIQQERLVGLRLGLLRHAQAIRYMISEIDGTTHVSSPCYSVHPGIETHRELWRQSVARTANVALVTIR